MPLFQQRHHSPSLSDGFLLGAIIIVVIVICALPSLLVLSRGLR